jgi:hypothetical protein
MLHVIEHGGGQLDAIIECGGDFVLRGFANGTQGIHGITG